jgi:hypothetical protein
LSVVVQRVAMSRKPKYVILIVVVPALLAIAYGTSMLILKPADALCADDAIALIEATLQADPNYIVTDSLVVHTKEPNCLVPTVFVDYLKPGLQVTVRKSASSWITRPRWYAKVDGVLKRFPRFLIPSSTFYSRRNGYKQTNIYVLEPTEEEMQTLEKHVRALGISRDVQIEFSSYFPDRQLMSLEH